MLRSAPRLDFFSSCRNIQLVVFRAESIVTCYTAITIDYLDLNNVFGMLPEAMEIEAKQ